jgi:8-oxo-dGDP phosphatase
MARKPLSVYVFVVVLVRRGFRYLLVQEAEEGQRGLWYLPAGALQAGEDLVAAAEREALTSAGVRISVTGIVAMEHMPRLPGWDFARWRFVVEAKMRADSPPPRTEPSAEALRAEFFMPSELEGLQLRGTDAADLVARHARGMPVAPISLYRVGLS